jgi:hypothetical protein
MYRNQESHSHILWNIRLIIAADEDKMMTNVDRPYSWDENIDVYGIYISMDETNEIDAMKIYDENENQISLQI